MDWPKQKQIPALIAAFAGTVLLLWGLSSLHTIFSREYSDATSEVLSRHETLEQYAVQAFRQSLTQQLAFTKINLENVLRDPLLPSDSVLYFKNQSQVLPRPAVYTQRENNQQAIALYEELMAADPIDLATQNPEPWLRLRDGLSRFKLAVESHDSTNIRWEFREINFRRNVKPLPGDKDIPYMMALLDYLLAFSTPEKSLVSNMLRTGSIIEQAYGNYGLQRALIAKRNEFTQEEFDFLKNRILTVSKRFEIPYEDFLAQANNNNPLLGIDVSLYERPVLISAANSNLQWYIEPYEGTDHLGTIVNSNVIVQRIEANMKSSGLLQEQDTLQLPENAHTAQLEHLSLSVHTPILRSKLKAAKERYWLKTLLLLTIAVLISSIAFLVLLILYRKHRYLALKADFVATVSHELKTPLASARVLAETIQRKTEHSDLVKDYPKRIIHAIDNMSLLVDNILSFNRLTKDSWNLRTSTVSIDAVVSGLTPEFIQYTNKPLSIDMNGPTQTETQADEELIKILFRNLVNNACKYNDRDTVDIEIRSETTAKGESVVYFSDNGVGIAATDQSEIFNEFSRMGDKHREVSGTGLGLAICKKILQLHRGDISVFKSGTEGTTFKLIFPAPEQEIA
ncbi:MAG: HAMP domain-containing histidine kinase [Gammaproteobacteria bacterium]|nr:HAMP domain-containing histidine kinase [Gammaproteobacteria bacterium]MDH5802047.1 HAMP domain-containing histidine kinase [Gammaproteobacteria bacterium]